MLPRKTYPDFGSLPGAQPTPGVDTTEIPARLGSPVALRRSGKTFWYDIFDDLNAWGGQTPPKHDLFHWGMFGPNCLRLRSDGVNIAWVTMSTPMIIGHTVGVEVSIGPPIIWPNSAKVTLQTFDQQTPSHEGDIQVVIGGPVGNQGYYYKNSGGSYVMYKSNTNWAARTWCNIKLVCDYTQGIYKYLSANEYDITPDYPMYNSGLSGAGLGISLYYEDTVVNDIYIDYLIITLDEY